MNFREKRGSVTIEATISLTAFIFCIVTFLSLINVCRVQARMATAIAGVAKEISQYSYFYGLTGLQQKEKDLGEQGATAKTQIYDVASAANGFFNAIQDLGETAQNTDMGDPEQIVGSWSSIRSSIENAATSTTEMQAQIQSLLKSNPKELIMGIGAMFASEGIDYAKSRLIAAPLAGFLVQKHFVNTQFASADDYLKAMSVDKGLEGLDFTNSSLFSKGCDDINIVVVYQVDIVQLLPINTQFTFCQSAKTRGWLTGDANPYANPQTKEEIKERLGSVWDVSTEERVELIRNIFRKDLRSQGISFPKGFTNVQGYDTADNKFITLVTLNTFTDAYANGFDEALNRATSRLKAETSKAGTFKVKTGQDNTVTQEVTSGSDKKYKIVLVIPDDAIDAEASIMKLLDDGMYNGVEIEIQKGFGEADPSKKIKESENGDA